MIKKYSKISFIIVNYNSRKSVLSCIEQIRRLNCKFEYEIIVSNNDIKDFPCSGKYIVINNGKNLGFGKANNIASKASSGEILIFVNPDILKFSKNFCDIIYYINDKVQIVAPKLLNSLEEPERWSYGRKVTPIRIMINNIFGFRDFCNNNPKCEVSWTSGAVFAIKKEIFEEIGGFDERFFLYYEDVDLCRRVKLNGGQILKINKYKAIHAGGGSLDENNLRKKYYYESQYLYIKKYYGNFIASIIKFLRKITH